MRVAFVGAGEIAVRTAEMLVERGHEVIVIEKEEAVIDDLSERMDCSFLHGDGSRPEILKEVNPKDTDVLFCLTDEDRINIIAALVGRSLGFKRVVIRIQDPSFEDICRELGLDDTIIPSRTIGRYLADMVSGLDIIELSTIIKGEARFFSFTVTKDEDAGDAGRIELPEGSAMICYYRDGRFFLLERDSRIRKGDEVVILTHSKNLPALQERWKPKSAGEGKK